MEKEKDDSAALEAFTAEMNRHFDELRRITIEYPESARNVVITQLEAAITLTDTSGINPEIVMQDYKVNKSYQDIEQCRNSGDLN